MAFSFLFIQKEEIKMERKQRDGIHFVVHNKKTLKTYKKEISKIAKELCYPKYIICDILNAKSEEEIDRIMINARKRQC